MELFLTAAGWSLAGFFAGLVLGIVAERCWGNHGRGN